jgi:inhibitor of cysteine peptidase
MKKFSVLTGVALMTVLMLAGCIGQIKTYTDSGQTIDIGVNQEFVIALGSNPTTGYSWQANYDETTLRLVEKTYEPGEAAKEGTVGAGGIEYFRFQALQAGKTEITLTYKRPWEEEKLDQKVFVVNTK